MIRHILAVSFVLSAFVATVGACKQGGVGDPCTPDVEYEPTFSGFNIKEAQVESKSQQCLTRVCLINHFRGRASCPYGQDPNGVGLTDKNGKAQPACTVPGTTTKITGETDPNQANARKKSCVPSQCDKRKADNAVYCSCRCANGYGKTDDGFKYCTCPDGFFCPSTPLIAANGLGNEGLAGSYCIKNNTEFDPAGDACGDKLGSNDRCDD